ncbi:unnamed protein product [Rhizophagus irregularis]|nr:unnamed protein product [Rhizophagus irregularis]
MKTGDDVRGEHQQDLDRKTNNNKDDISSDNDKKIDKKNESEDNPITHDEVYKLIETKVDEGNKLMHENEALKKKNSLLKETIKSYEKSYNKLVSQNQHYENYIRKCESKIQELNKELKDSYKESKNNKEHAENFKTELIKIQKELDAKQENINELKKNNVALREEASKYQSALGVAANFRISDDKNHSVQLKNDILSLQDAIEDYVTNLKGNVEVNIENVEKLAQKYGCLTNIITEKTKRQNKSFIKAVLQRYVLEVIITNANDYFDYLENTDTLHLESEILMKTNDLCLKLDKFSETRTGTDKITSTSSIKIRQEAYAALTYFK